MPRRATLFRNNVPGVAYVARAFHGLTGVSGSRCDRRAAEKFRAFDVFATIIITNYNCRDARKKRANGVDHQIETNFSGRITISCISAVIPVTRKSGRFSSSVKTANCGSADPTSWHLLPKDSVRSLVGGATVCARQQRQAPLCVRETTNHRGGCVIRVEVNADAYYITDSDQYDLTNTRFGNEHENFSESQRTYRRRLEVVPNVPHD